MVAELTLCRWGILGTGSISEKFVHDLLIDPSTREVSDVIHKFSAVGSRSLSKAHEFINRIAGAQDHLPKAYGSYQELVQDPEIDVIYIGTPHSLHFPHAMLCLNNKKNTLCEKPLTVNAGQAQELCKVAQQNKCFLMEAVWTRFFPITYSFQEVIASGRIGELQEVNADFSIDFQPESISPNHRLVSPQLAGGALLDLGPYSWTMLALTLVHQYNKEISKTSDLLIPKIIASGDLYSHPHTSTTSCPVDGSVEAVLEFPTSSGGKVKGLLKTSMLKSGDPERSVTVYGTKGQIRIPYPPCSPCYFGVSLYEEDSRDNILSNKGCQLGKEEIHGFEIPGKAHGYMWEADEVARCIAFGQLESKRMPHSESILMMEVFDEIRQQIGVIYPESVEAFS